MEHTAPAILDLGLLLFLAALAGRGARALGLPAVIGYLVVGVLVSPFTPGYVANREQLSVLADVGVVLLLFEVGIEINPLRLAREGRRLLALAPIQVAATWLVSAVACYLLGIPLGGAAMIGLSIAMSSSVVVVNITRSRRRTTDRRTDEVLLGWSLIQDLVGVSAALILVVILGIGGRSGVTAIAGVVAFAVVSAVAAFVLPWLLRRLQTEHDLFLLVSVASGLLLAGVGSQFLGVPLALAAFVAGLAITESPVAAEARQRLLPFRDLFAVMFFVALGTVVNPADAARAAPWLLAFLAMVIAGKVVVVWVARQSGASGRAHSAAGRGPWPGRRVQLRPRSPRPGRRVDHQGGERRPHRRRGREHRGLVHPCSRRGQGAGSRIFAATASLNVFMKIAIIGSGKVGKKR